MQLYKQLSIAPESCFFNAVFYKKMVRKIKIERVRKMKFTDKELNEVLVQVKPEEVIDELANLKYSNYLRTEYWQLIRKGMHESIGYKCEICGSEEHINIHHFNYENLGKETLNDLACLCQRCHVAIHYTENNILNTKICNRRDFEKQMTLSRKIKKILNNEKYLKVLPLTKKPLWNLSQVQLLFGYSEKQALKYLKNLMDDKLVAQFKIVHSKNDIDEFYFVNQFIWFLIELDFPKVGD